MFFQKQFLAVVGATLLALHFSTAPSRAEDGNQPINSRHPNELINKPVCWSAEEPDPSRHCDFAQNFWSGLTPRTAASGGERGVTDMVLKRMGR